MTPIQWTLLVVVVAAVVAVYFYVRHHAGEDPWADMGAEADATDDQRQGVSLGGDSYIVDVRTLGSSDVEPAETQPQPQNPVTAVLADDESWKNFDTQSQPDDAKQTPPAPEVGQIRPRAAASGREELFVLHVAGRGEQQFDGPDVHAALADQKLSFGLHNIYHRITEIEGVPESVYAVANMLKPGFLDPVEQDQLRTPGLTLFLQLPGPLDGSRAARDMLDTAHALARRLDGEVLDDRRSLLKPQTEQYMFDRIAEVTRQQRVQAHR